ncbi:hypothetical protein HDF08_002630 [Edaphobacter lichenicola]|uniref:Uncharacterized protein n=1 Tax=Tunturiibacter lichenicola TaxID=2051959 RepID=A0A852VCB1_9BACT|nr:hypothetical protein [Edaphobacter lichenicola]
MDFDGLEVRRLWFCVVERRARERGMTNGLTNDR